MDNTAAETEKFVSALQARTHAALAWAVAQVENYVFANWRDAEPRGLPYWIDYAKR